MKYLLSALLLLSFMTIAHAQSSVPSVEVKTLEGETIDISEYIQPGKNYVISFWATWCSPCKKELDAISEVYEEWQEEYDIELLAITIDNARALAKVKPMVMEKGWEYTIFSDPNQKLFQALNGNTVPQTYVVDAKGEIVYSHTGYVPGDEYELEDKLVMLSGK